MIRTVVIPKSTQLMLDIPAALIGKKVRVTLRLDEEEAPVTEEDDVMLGPVHLRGSLKLSEKAARDLDQYLHDVRNEWERES